jgi:hypothetical protein
MDGVWRILGARLDIPSARRVAMLSQTSQARSVRAWLIEKVQRAAAAKAMVATACKIARIVYHRLKDKREYVGHGADLIVGKPKRPENRCEDAVGLVLIELTSMSRNGKFLHSLFRPPKQTSRAGI